MLTASLRLLPFVGFASGATVPPGSTEFTIVDAVRRGPATLEVRCPGAAPISVTSTTHFTVEGVGPGVCTAQMTGTTRARFRPVVAGESYQCVAAPRSLFCNSYREQTPPRDPSSDAPVASVSAPSGGGAVGSVRVELAPSDVALWGLVVCPGGARIKATFEAGVAQFGEVPDEDCMLSLKGGAPVRFAGVRPHDRIRCAAAGDSVVCQDERPPTASSEAGGRTGAGASERPVPRKAPGMAVAPDELVVRIADPSTHSWLYVQCPSGFRQRADFVGGMARVQSVPAEACTLSFKGGSPTRFAGVSGGQVLTCAISGGIADCR